MSGGPSGRAPAGVLAAVMLAISGGIADIAWRLGLWGLLTGTVLVALILVLTIWRGVARAPRDTGIGQAESPRDAGHRLLLDAAPTPMLSIDDGVVRALNRAARRLFATDDRVSPVPDGLAGHENPYLRYAGRRWRVDRVMLGPGRSVVALIDVEQERHRAEARANAEMIQVLGHELFNGLAPIASLAESGLAAMDDAASDPAMLREVLGTLARRADGLQRFADSYRALARLPDPRLAPVRVADLADDLARLFAARWPQVALVVDADREDDWPIDRDQISQAVWALLQNAAEAAVGMRGGDAGVALAIHRGDGLVIEVSDKGDGVARDIAPAIFRPFYTTKSEGSGIGLSLARQIVNAHGGTLSLDPEHPATFRIALPAR